MLPADRATSGRSPTTRAEPLPAARGAAIVSIMSLRERTPPTADEYADYRTRFSNWGRWGDDDELGTLHFVTPDVRGEAAALVREGRVVSCSRPVNTSPGPANPYPARHMVAVTGSGAMCDYLSLFIHGFTETHIDALCHLATVE